MKEQIKAYFNSLLNKTDKIRLAVIFGAAGMLLIFISELIPEKHDTAVTAEEETSFGSDETESFRLATEAQLRGLLEKIEGVGSCEVMVTVEGTTEYVYAENISRYTDSSPERCNEKCDNDVVIVGNGADKQALVRKIIRPRISGVVVVCEGGGDTKVNERVLKAVSTALNISSNRVCVENKTKQK